MPTPNEEIGTTAKALIEALSLTGDPTVSVRKELTQPAGADIPEIVVVVDENYEAEPLTATEDICTYLMRVAIFTAAAGALQDDATVKEWRLAIRRALASRSAFITGVVETSAPRHRFNEIHPGGRSPFNRQALEKLLNCSLLDFRCEVIEDRYSS